MFALFSDTYDKHIEFDRKARNDIQKHGKLNRIFLQNVNIGYLYSNHSKTGNGMWIVISMVENGRGRGSREGAGC